MNLASLDTEEPQVLMIRQLDYSTSDSSQLRCSPTSPIKSTRNLHHPTLCYLDIAAQMAARFKAFRGLFWWIDRAKCPCCLVLGF
jgi:hypothetical protein